MELLKDANFDFIGRIKLLLGISAASLLISIAAIAIFGLNLGIDFAGGYEIQAKFDKSVSESKIRELIEPIVAGEARIQRIGEEEENEYLIMVREHGTLTDADKVAIKGAFEELAGGAGKLNNWAVAESGERLTVGFAQAITEQQVRDVLAKFSVNVKKIVRNERQDQPEYTVELVSLSEHIENALRSGLSIPADHPLIGRVEFVGPQVGNQLRNQGFMALVYALAFILIYIAIRFDFFFSPGAVIALVHDLVITVGVFAIFRLEFNLPIIAALLTLVGYSLNDTIVVYDRIRENVVRMRGSSLRTLVNASINQTLSRTILTGGCTLLVIVALLWFGGATIRDFSLALLIGILVGTYSSVAVASPIYVLCKERYGKKPTSRDTAPHYAA